MRWSAWTSHWLYSRLFPSTHFVRSAFVWSWERSRFHWEVLDAGVISDLILNQVLPLSPFLPCTLQGVSLVLYIHISNPGTISSQPLVRDISPVLKHLLRSLTVTIVWLVPFPASARPPCIPSTSAVLLLGWASSLGVQSMASGPTASCCRTLTSWYCCWSSGGSTWTYRYTR